MERICFDCSFVDTEYMSVYTQVLRNNSEIYGKGYLFPLRQNYIK